MNTESIVETDISLELRNSPRAEVLALFAVTGFVPRFTTDDHIS